MAKIAADCQRRAAVAGLTGDRHDAFRVTAEPLLAHAVRDSLVAVWGFGSMTPGFAGRLFALALASALTPGAAIADDPVRLSSLWSRSLETKAKKAIGEAPGLPCRLDRVTFKDLRGEARFQASRVSECFRVSDASMPINDKCASRQQAERIAESAARDSVARYRVRTVGETKIEGDFRGSPLVLLDGDHAAAPCCYTVSADPDADFANEYEANWLDGDDVPVVTKDNAALYAYEISSDSIWAPPGPLKGLVLIPYECRPEATGELQSRRRIVVVSDILR